MMSWNAVKVVTGKEAYVLEALLRQGYEAYGPRVSVDKKTTKKKIDATEAMYPSYVFVWLVSGVHNFAPIKYTKAVISLILCPVYLEKPMELFIRDLKARENAENVIAVSNRDYSYGDGVRIVNGPFDGSPGVIDETSGKKAIVLVDVFGRSVRIGVEYGQIRPDN